MTRCLAAADFERYHAGMLAAQERGEVEAHLSTCAACSEQYAAYVKGLSLMKKLRSAPMHRGDTVDLPPGELAEAQPEPDRTPARSRAHEGGSLPQPTTLPGYELLSEVHRGGQGVVYQAVQLSTRRRVAIKVLKEGPFAGPADRSRFEREVQILAQLSHPNIVAIHDSGISSGLYYFVMDYVSGLSLDEHVAGLRRTAREGELIRPVLQLFVRVCSALAVAHARGVVHRDLKPSNIRVGADGEPRVLDFGLAKLATRSDDAPVTRTGQFLGSLPWAAPEQAEGRPDRIDARTDVYALGVILFQLLTSRFPYPVTGGIHETLQRIINAEPPRPGSLNRAIDDEIDTIVLKCLQKERERRYAHAGELEQDLARYLAGEPIEAKRASHWYRLRKQLPRYKLSAALLLAAVIALVGLGVGNMQRARMREQTARLAAQMDAQRERLIEQCQDAILLMDAGQLERLLQRAAEVQLDAGHTHVYRGWAAYVQVDMERATSEAELAIQASPNLADAYYLRAGIHAFHDDRVRALADLSRARSLSSGTILHETFDGILQLAMGRLDEGLAAMDRLVQRRQSAGLSLWMRGFGRWMVLLRYPSADIEERWRLATASLDDLNAAAKLYPNTLFVFDVRIDLTRRMIQMAPVCAARPPAEPLIRQCREDCATLSRLGAEGPALRGLAGVEWVRGDYPECAKLAQAAFERLRGPTAIRGIHYRDALSESMRYLLLTAYLQGDEEGRVCIAGLSDQPIDGSLRFVFAVVRGASADRVVLLNDSHPLGSPLAGEGESGLGLWLGAAVRGDADLARAVARRCSVSTVARLTDRWPGAVLRYMQGREGDERLMATAGTDATRVGLARLMGAVTKGTREGCLAELRTLSALALGDSSHEVAAMLIARAEREPAFLANVLSINDLRSGNDRGGQP